MMWKLFENENLSAFAKPFLPCKSKKYNIFCVCVCVCRLSYPASKASARFYIATCGLSGFTTFFSILSHKENDLEIKILNLKFLFWFPHYFCLKYLSF